MFEIGQQELRYRTYLSVEINLARMEGVDSGNNRRSISMGQ